MFKKYERDKSRRLGLNMESRRKELGIREIIDGGVAHHPQGILSTTISGFLSRNLSDQKAAKLIYLKCCEKKNVKQEFHICKTVLQK